MVMIRPEALDGFGDQVVMSIETDVDDGKIRY